MSTGGPGGPPMIEYMTRPRRIHMMIDLNMPPRENGNHEGTSSHMNSSNVHAGGSPSGAPIDVDALEDEVVVMSPRAFAESGNSARRNRGSTVVIDVDSDERVPTVSPVNSTRPRQEPSDVAVINLEGGAYEMWQRQNIQLHQSPTPPPPPPPPPAPIFPCPICRGPLVEEMSTKCGHIFCKACIASSIALQPKCPTCRKKVTAKDIIRIYLPTPDE